MVIATKPGTAPASATSPAEEIARLEQALEDLSRCEAAGVSLIHCPNRTRERTLARELGASARARAFVTAELSLRERGLESLDLLVRALLARLVPPGESRPQGLLYLLELFYDLHGSDSAERFAAEAMARGASGDLTALCRAYLASDDADAVPEKRAFAAWRDGVEPPRKYRNRAVRRALSDRTAQRNLGELTRILRALGHRGLLLVFSEGDALAARTERQREKAYTVLRELVDNFDGARGAAATRVVLTGQDALFEGARSVQVVAPLRMRLAIPSAAEPPPPHRSWTTLVRESGRRSRRPAEAPPARGAGAVHNLVRISQGLPPTSGVAEMSVGRGRLDRTIKRLFELVDRSGRFFSVLVGDYGSGKTHLMMHLAERAREDRRPVFWLNLERANLDLGNPARHLCRFLDHSELPLKGTPNALALASRWTRAGARMGRLRAELAAIEATGGEAAAAARKGLRIAAAARDPGFALENYLAAADLEDRPGDASYRRDAYRRILLWFELLARLEKIRGPVVLIDEAENLYTSGRAPASRRTARRSLAFYCGGALPATCVVLAMTPPAFELLKREARDLLAEANDMETTLDVEDVARFRRSLWGLKPEPIQPLSPAAREQLAERVREMHRSARGKVSFPGWQEHVRSAVAAHRSPRALVRALVDELEAAWWAERPARRE